MHLGMGARGYLPLVVSGGIVRVARVKDEWYAPEVVPEVILGDSMASGCGADIFTFAQKLPDVKPRYSKYHLEWDNVAVVPLTDYSAWWNGRIPKQTRTHVRRAEKKGVAIKRVEFSDSLVVAIQDIYNESPIRQGKPFRHYGLDFRRLKEMKATYLDRAAFIGAYYGDEMIGFVKLVFTGATARMMHIFSKEKHRDKAPNNAMIAKAVELCCEQGLSYLVYGQYDSGKGGGQSLAVFKQENGFERIEIPRYYVPLTWRGRVALKYGLHHGVREVLPACLIASFLAFRRQLYSSGAFRRIKRPL